MSTMNRVVLNALMLLAIAGCDSTGRPPSGRNDPLPPGQYTRINALDTLDKWLFFGQPIVTEGDPENPLLVEVPVRNRSNETINIQYSFEFYDRQGRLLTRNPSWRYMTLAPKIENRFAGTGTDPAAVDWRLNVRSAK
jgi:uncharacterized protein YcfL